MSRTSLVAAALGLSLAFGPSALAQTKVRVGQPQVGTFQFVPLQVGIEAGIFKKHKIDLEVISFGGGPRVQQALAAESIDIGIGSGPELAFVAKGAPELGVAAMADAPYSVVLAVPKDSPIKTAEDLKGKTISISSNGSLTHWLGQELSRQMGWGSAGINLAPLGSTAAQMAALRTRQIDGMIVEANAGYKMEEDSSGRVLVQFGDRIKVFHIYVFYARKGFLEKNPEAGTRLSGRVVRDHRIYARASKRDHRHRAPHRRGVAWRRRPRLRRADGDVQPDRQVRPQCARRPGAFLRRDGLAAAGSRHAHAHHRTVSAGCKVSPLAVGQFGVIAGPSRRPIRFNERVFNGCAGQARA